MWHQRSTTRRSTAQYGRELSGRTESTEQKGHVAVYPPLQCTSSIHPKLRNSEDKKAVDADSDPITKKGFVVGGDGVVTGLG